MPETTYSRIMKVLGSGSDFATARRLKNRQKSYLVAHAIRCSADTLYLHEMYRKSPLFTNRIQVSESIHGHCVNQDLHYFRQTIQGIGEGVSANTSGETISAEDKRIFDDEVHLLTKNLLEEFDQEFGKL